MIDLEKPMHFTKEQSEWIKQYVILKRKEARAEVIDECIKFIKEHSGEHYIDCDGYFGGRLELVFNVDDWIDDLEQLKENK